MAIYMLIRTHKRSATWSSMATLWLVTLHGAHQPERGVESNRRYMRTTFGLARGYNGVGSLGAKSTCQLHRRSSNTSLPAFLLLSHGDGTRLQRAQCRRAFLELAKCYVTGSA